MFHIYVGGVFGLPLMAFVQGPAGIPRPEPEREGEGPDGIWNFPGLLFAMILMGLSAVPMIIFLILVVLIAYPVVRWREWREKRRLQEEIETGYGGQGMTFILIMMFSVYNFFAWVFGKKPIEDDDGEDPPPPLIEPVGPEDPDTPRWQDQYVD